ncbi:MAG: type II toxin-antitoxin system RelE/ParE family toxin, partial [Planctomycetaceae bacterium]
EFMSLPVVLRPEATKDAAEAIGYFDALRPGLGQAFLIQVQDVLLRISGMPELHGIVWRNVRAARLRRFTYVVYYRVLEDRLEVLAVVQGNRDAAVWQSRE